MGCGRSNAVQQAWSSERPTDGHFLSFDSFIILTYHPRYKVTGKSREMNFVDGGKSQSSLCLDELNPLNSPKSPDKPIKADILNARDTYMKGKKNRRNGSDVIPLDDIEYMFPQRKIRFCSDTGKKLLSPQIKNKLKIPSIFSPNRNESLKALEHTPGSATLKTTSTIATSTYTIPNDLASRLKKLNPNILARLVSRDEKMTEKKYQNNVKLF